MRIMYSDIRGTTLARVVVVVVAQNKRTHITHTHMSQNHNSHFFHHHHPSIHATTRVRKYAYAVQSVRTRDAHTMREFMRGGHHLYDASL